MRLLVRRAESRDVKIAPVKARDRRMGFGAGRGDPYPNRELSASADVTGTSVQYIGSFPSAQSIVSVNTDRNCREQAGQRRILAQ
jgi:hypothetical protein